MALPQTFKGRLEYLEQQRKLKKKTKKKPIKKQKEVKKKKKKLDIWGEPKKWEKCDICGTPISADTARWERRIIWWFDYYLCKSCFRATENKVLWTLVTTEMWSRHMKRILLKRMGKLK